MQDLKDEEDENPRLACTSSLQGWQRSRMDGISPQPVMEVVVSNPANNADKSRKTGVACLLTETRGGSKDGNKNLQSLIQSLSQHSSKLGLVQVVDASTVNNLPLVHTS